jgi:hypothetical protein
VQTWLQVEAHEREQRVALSTSELAKHEDLQFALQICCSANFAVTPLANVSQPHCEMQASDSPLFKHCCLHSALQAFDGAIRPRDTTPTKRMVVYLLNMLEILKNKLINYNSISSSLLLD